MYEEGRSFLSGKLGTKVLDSKINLIDDPFNMKGFPAAFDFEGIPKKRVHLVRSGVAENVVYDTLTATRAKKKSTGHALSAPNPFGPIPMHIILKGGDSSLEDMIKQTEKGILVTRFHYTNVIDPYKLIITGMTRDGTFLIEKGVITRGLKNLRFTENVIEALNRVSAIARKPELAPFEPGYGGRLGRGVFAPALKIDDFTFTSATEF
jgi:predicted Zn-dependent protease